MKHLSFILFVLAVIGWSLYYIEHNSKPIVGKTIVDTVWTEHIITAPSPEPIILDGEPVLYPVPYIDWNAVDSLAALKADTISLVRYLAQTFIVHYEDSIRSSHYTVFPVNKKLKDSTYYKPFRIQEKEIHHTAYIDSEPTFKLFAGSGYAFDNKPYFFFDVQCKIANKFYLTPRVSTSGISAEAKYNITF